MFKSILAVSEGGPDAGMSFKLAARVAGLFDGASTPCTCRLARPAAWWAAWR